MGSPNPSEQRDPESTSRPASPEGVGGWLLFFAFTQVLALLVGAVGVPYLFGAEFAADWNAADHWPMYRAAVVSSGLHSLLLTGGAAVGLYLLFSRDHRTPRFYRAWLLSLAILGMVILVSSWFGFGEIIRELSDPVIKGVRASEMRLHDFAMTGRGIIVALIWYQYWVKSRRVAATFTPPYTPPPLRPILPT